MWLSARTFWAQKAGNSKEEYEDAFCPSACVESERDVKRFRYAIADGATQTSFSRRWAELLVHAYCRGQVKPIKLAKSLEPLQQQWYSEIKEKPLPWFAQEKVRQGAFSTLLGLTLGQSNGKHEASGIWSVFAVGDSCIFQIRDNELLLSFPLTVSQQFDNSPALLSSNPISNENVRSFSHQYLGTWIPGDLFFLMTDALACWFLRRYEQEDNPISQLTAIRSQDDFLNLVEAERMSLDNQGRKLLRNDDLTFFRILVS